MNHSPCLELDDEKSKEGSKEEIGHLQEVPREAPRAVPSAEVPGPSRSMFSRVADTGRDRAVRAFPHTKEELMPLALPAPTVRCKVEAS
jgi:hypothetical protein